MVKIEKERGFSLEIKSMKHISTLSLEERFREQVLIEGTIGKLNDLGWNDGAVLVVNGEKGTIQIDLTKVELMEKLLEES